MTASQEVLQRVVVVSGGSSGIGFATAAHFLASGDKVAFYGENAARVDAACEMLASRFGTGPVIGKVVDQRDRAALEDFFMHVSRTWGAPDVLVCNAGISPKGPDGARIPFARISPEAWQDVLTTNLTAAAWACQFVLPAMALKGCGRIVLVGSVASRALPRIAGGAYTVSKAGLSGLMRAILGEYAPQGVTVNIVSPGRILTEMTGSSDTPANRAALARTAVNRLGCPEDVARAIGFLAAAASHFIAGATLDVNGGEFVAP